MPFVVFVIGASGIIAQIVLIRELLINFQGNELSIGIILGNWLITESLGSYLFRKIKITSQSLRTIILIFALILPVVCIITQTIRPILGFLPGEITNIPLIFISSFFILLPVGFLHGALFTSSTSVLTHQQKIDERKIPGYVYLLENTGTIIGGVLISFLLIPFLSTIQIALTVTLINLIAVLFLACHGNHKSKLLYYSLIIFSGFLFAFSSKIEQWALKQNYPNYTVLASTNTIYGNITTIKREEQYTFLIDGVPTILSPYPDQTFVEDFVHFPLLFHPAPKKILIIGGAAGGILTQMLKHPVQEIFYLELDPYLIKTIKKFSTSLIDREFSDPRVKLIYLDARAFIEKETTKFDLIFINYTTPLSLQSNRFFTQEFYQSCKKRLNTGGLFVTLSLGSLVYISPTIRKIIKTHINTLQSVFLSNDILPGDFNLYLSSCKQSSGNLQAETLFNRLMQRKIPTDLFSLGYIQYRTNKYNIDWLQQTLQNDNEIKTSLTNQDNSPRGLLYSLYHWNTIASPSLQKLFSTINKINLRIIIYCLIIILLFLLLFRKRYGYRLYLPFSIFTTGIIAMVFSLVLSLGFQIRYGFLYYQISILLTTFIAGSTLGGYIGNFHFADKMKYFLLTELFIILLLCILALSLKNQAYPKIFGRQIDFYIFLFISGLLVGLQFPLANRLFKHSSVTQTVGKLYAADLFGGFIGAITIAIILIPAIGIYQTIILSILLKITSASLLLTPHQFSNAPRTY